MLHPMFVVHESYWAKVFPCCSYHKWVITMMQGNYALCGGGGGLVSVISYVLIKISVFVNHIVPHADILP